MRNESDVRIMFLRNFRCLKLYCQCFASSTTCGPRCKCQGCQNTTEHGEEIERARQTILERNPSAFDEKFPGHGRLVTGPSPYQFRHPMGSGTTSGPEFSSHMTPPPSSYPPPRSSPSIPHPIHQYSASKVVTPPPPSHPPSFMVQSTPMHLPARSSPPLQTDTNKAKGSESLSENDRGSESGCKCRKSFCLKKYCDCFQNSTYCGLHCRCTNCKNFPDATNGNSSDRSVATSETTDTSVSLSTAQSADVTASAQLAVPIPPPVRARSRVQPLRQVSMSSTTGDRTMETEDMSSSSVSSLDRDTNQNNFTSNNRNDSSQLSTAGLRCPPPPDAKKPVSSRQVRRVSQQEDLTIGEVTRIPLKNKEEQDDEGKETAEYEPNSTIGLNKYTDGVSSSMSEPSGADALAIIAAVAMTELVGGINRTPPSDNVTEHSSDSGRSVSVQEKEIRTPTERPCAQNTHTSIPGGEVPADSSAPKRQPKRKNGTENDIRLPFKKRRTPSPRPTPLEPMNKEIIHATNQTESVERMASSMTLESRNPSPVGSTNTTNFVSGSSPTETARTLNFDPKRVTSEAPPLYYAPSAPHGGAPMYSSSTYQHLAPPPPKGPLTSYTYHKQSQHAALYGAPSSFHNVDPQTTPLMSQPQTACQPVNRSYEETMRSCGLPKSLSFRKICSKCGKTRSEHGELGFGNKCVFQECGKCLAGIHMHRKAGQPMGILCQLTVQQGATPGAAVLYDRKIRQLAARAELQRAMQKRNKKVNERGASESSLEMEVTASTAQSAVAG